MSSYPADNADTGTADKTEVINVAQVAGIARAHGLHINDDAESVVDMSRGCDQRVYCVDLSTSDTSASVKAVIKIPTREKDKVDKQRIMSTLTQAAGMNVATVLLHTEDFLIESFIPGKMLTLAGYGDHVGAWVELGRQMKMLHSIPGASGFSNRVEGELCTKFPIYSTFQEKMLGCLVWEQDAAEADRPPRVDEYLTNMINYLPDHAPVYLHYDVHFDNVEVTASDVGQNTGSVRVTLIDYADAGMGHPLEDFASLCCNLYELPQLEYLIQGYGGLTAEDRIWVEFFCVVRLAWSLSGKNDIDKREHQLTVANKIINRGLEWLRTKVL
jgi:hypothetical protein